jgi:hypothetical protein
MFQYDECNRISWEEIFKDPILTQKNPKSRILDFELNKSSDHAINKSIEKHLN